MQNRGIRGATQTTGLGNLPRLLVIDDELVQRTIISKIGQQVGYEVLAVASFEDATRMLQNNAYDCITLDLSLGEHSGTQLLRSIAEAGKTSVIVISGCEERVLNSTVRLANMLGISCIQIPKPLDLTELRHSLSAKLPNQPCAHAVTSTVQAIEASELSAALNRDEIVPWFQPKVELATGKIVGCEALARWRHPMLGTIAPDVFIPLAETVGLMPQLTDRLLRAATHAMRGIVKNNPGFSVAVNVSASLLSDLSLADRIDRALAESALPASALTIEITESAVMSDIVKATDILVGLRVKGVGVAIDDFGTGYSSLAALARMPFSELKIDKLFVCDSESNRDMTRVVRACVQLGHELDMKVVAEGIETVASWTRLHESGCDIGQGHAFAPALDSTSLTTWIEQWRQRNVMLNISPATVA
jgi:EAL domain-containing protein (putative c-di-GMP-specific phosphodiesterase class I)/ActR/RegA family two-component response regulator